MDAPKAAFRHDGVVVVARLRVGRVEPSREAIIPVVEKFERVKAMIEKKRPLSTVTTCMVGINALFFDDGTEWLSPGLYFRPDPDAPGRHVLISQKEFDAYRQEASQ